MTHRAIADQVKRLRLTRGISQHDLAARAGLTQVQLSRIETGKVLSRFQTIEALVQALGATLMVVPFERVDQVEHLIGREEAKVDAGSTFDDVFVPDPDGDAEGSA